MSKHRKLGDICTITKGEIGIMKAIPGKYCMIGLGEEDKTHNEYQFDAKAVIVPLISSTGHGSATMKRVKYYEGKFALGTILSAVIPKDENVVLAKYLHLYLHENRNDLLVPLMKGAANVTLPIKRLYDVLVPIPAIEYQKKYIELEESLSKQVKKLNNEIELQRECLSKLKLSILQDAICGKLTEDWREANPNIEPASELLKRIKAEKQRQIKEGKIRKEKPVDPINMADVMFDIPSTWEWCRLSSIYQSTSGGTPSRSNSKFWHGDITWYKSGELNDSVLASESEENITLEGLKGSSATMFPSGTLLIAMYGATAGKLSILQRNATTNQAVCGLYENRHIDTEYMFYYLMSQRSKMIEDSWGMSQPNISQTYLKAFLVPIPPQEEQKRIIEIIKMCLEKCSLIEAQITANEKTAQNLLKSILSETFNNN